jgi:hypothetical protein
VLIGPAPLAVFIVFAVPKISIPTDDLPYDLLLLGEERRRFPSEADDAIGLINVPE